MARYRVNERSEEGVVVVQLVDEVAGVLVEVVPSVGAQLHRWTLTQAGDEIQLLVGASSVHHLAESPMMFGNPILFPFPNRIKGGRFSFDGVEVNLPVNEAGADNAIHGLVFDRPWKMVGAGSDGEEGAWVTCRFASEDHADVSQVFPFPFVIEYTYRLKDGAIHNETVVENVGKDRMPMGFGLHPWFPAPLETGEVQDPQARSRLRLEAPVSRIWELKDLIPTGTVKPAEPGRDLSVGIVLGDQEFDDVYAGLNEGLDPEEMSESTYTDPAAGRSIVVTADSGFRELVVYAPRDRGVICIEPYTCATDAFNLANQGIDAGMIVLEPGDSWSSYVRYETRQV